MGRGTTSPVPGPPLPGGPSAPPWQAQYPRCPPSDTPPAAPEAMSAPLHSHRNCYLQSVMLLPAVGPGTRGNRGDVGSVWWQRCGQGSARTLSRSPLRGALQGPAWTPTPSFLGCTSQKPGLWWQLPSLSLEARFRPGKQTLRCPHPPNLLTGWSPARFLGRLSAPPPIFIFSLCFFVSVFVPPPPKDSDTPGLVLTPPSQPLGRVGEPHSLPPPPNLRRRGAAGLVLGEFRCG